MILTNQKIFVTSAFMVVLLFGCSKTSENNSITIKWGETLAESHPSAQMAIRAGKEITERTKGRVKVKFIRADN